MEHPEKKCFKCGNPVTVGMQFIEQEYKPFGMDYAPCITLFSCNDHINNAKKELANQLLINRKENDLSPVPCEETYQKIKKQIFGDS